MRHTVKAAEELLDKQFPVLDHGFVILVDYMGSDAAIAEAARQSLAGDGTRKVSDDRALIRYLVSHLHTSPLEMVELKFHCAMPIFVARQWIRHRTANVNEQSGRYGEMPELVYVPEAEQIAYQSPVNKQGRGAIASPEVAATFRSTIAADAKTEFDIYHEFLGKTDPSRCEGFNSAEYAEIQANGGISREVARINLPLSTYTQWYWKLDLHNLLHFLFLRLDEHAQWEIRQYAKVMAEMVRALCPIAWEAFVDYRQRAIRLSLPELEALAVLVEQFHAGRAASLEGHETRMSRREVEELRAKLGPAGLGLGFLTGF